jgi:hypothetical protein
MISQEANLILQSYITISLISELRNNGFLESEFFGQMKFGSPWIKDALMKIGADNQGSALMALYAMLVIPRQLIFEEYPEKVEAIQNFLRSNAQNTKTTYKSDTPKIDFLRHIRNAVSHSRVSFREKDVVIFYDQYKDQEFSTELPLRYFGWFMNELQEIHLEYIRSHQ